MTVRLIAFTLAVLSLANAYSFVRLYSSTYISNNKKIVTHGPVSERFPASIPPGLEIVPTQNLNSQLAFDLNCGVIKKNSTMKVSANWIQLKGRLCRGDKIKSVEITNLKNGFTASFFNLGANGYRTDLIQLDNGENKIQVKITPTKGEIEEQTVLVKGDLI